MATHETDRASARMDIAMSSFFMVFLSELRPSFETVGILLHNYLHCATVFAKIVSHSEREVRNGYKI